MDLALKQYQTLVQKKVWGVDSAEHKEILNLSAQIVTLQKKLTASKKNPKPKPGSSEKQRMTGEEYRKMRYDKAPKWMKQKPSNISDTRTHGKQKYSWCTYHKLWQRHTALDCRLNPANKDRQQSNNSNDDKRDNKSKSAIQHRWNDRSRQR
jgi:hypothetical protein